MWLLLKEDSRACPFASIEAWSEWLLHMALRCAHVVTLHDLIVANVEVSHVSLSGCVRLVG